MRPSTIAVLRSNSHVLELMAAQFEELASRTTSQTEYESLQYLARKCRILAGDMSQSLSTAA